MNLTILGTGAAEAVPGMFCPCRVCETARRAGGREVRTRTSYMLGDEIRIDMSVDAQWQAVRNGLDHNSLRHLLVTHSHEDHFHPVELHYRRRGFCQTPEGSPLRIWGNAHVLAAAGKMADNLADLQVELHLIRAFERFEIAPGIRVTPILASHAADDEEALNFAIDCHGTTVLIGNDTGYWPDEVWERVGDLSFDIAVIDSTYGVGDSCHHHMGTQRVVTMRDRMGESGMLREGARVIANHFSHNGDLTHAELVQRYGRYGIEVAYDGMEVDLAGASHQTPPVL